ncbi:MAG TPA: hypothetical protein VKR43_02910 [Bryobacteraceae bacterium]|nr:hypothetical protein [Bryobacteraceae bacterium]
MRTFALIYLAATLLPAQPSPEITGGPTRLVITYRCPPPRRAAFRQYMNEYGIQRFEHWKQDGLLSDYRFLFNWYVDVDAWDAMAVLSFPSYAQIARWKDIERASPGGLMRDALDMAWPLNTYPSDLVSSADPGQPHNAGQSVFFVVPYDNPNGSDFRELLNSWIVPQAKASMQEGILAGYQVFKTRYPGAKRWQGLLVLEYKDFDSFSRRDEVNAKIRSQLNTNPALRTAEREPIIADALVPR